MRRLAIILAGGAGTRMGAAVNKQFLRIKGKPIVVHTLEAFEKARSVDGIYFVVNEKDLAVINEDVLGPYTFRKIVKTVIGGPRRQDSVRNGLNAIEGPCDTVLIHDGARPFVSPAFIDSSTALMADFDAIVPALDLQDTVKAVSNDGFVLQTPDRASLKRIQTPQIFKYDLILRAYNEYSTGSHEGYDDASFAEHLGAKVKVIKGSPYNLKITTPEDLVIAEALMTHMEQNR